MTTSLTAALAQVFASSKETGVQRLFWEIQMGVKGRRGGDLFPWFPAPSFSMLLPSF